jgi:hypothetical protein
MPLTDGRYLEPVVSTGRARSWGGGTQARRSSTQVALKQVVTLDGKASPVGVARGIHDILIVDPDPQALLAAQVAVEAFAEVEICSDFRAARARLASNPPDLLVTNIRLERFNGLHLVYVAAGSATRCLVYANHHDPVLAREVVAAGAFYERADRLPRVLAAYARAILPPKDRRSLSVGDRRSLPRGGRRSSDT